MADSMEPCKMLWARPLLPWQRNLARLGVQSPIGLYIILFNIILVNKLKINSDKTKEIVFRRPGACNFISPAALSGIEQITSVKLLGIHLTATLSDAARVEHISIAN